MDMSQQDNDGDDESKGMHDNENNKLSTRLPRVALRWLLQNSVTSDTELANLSNVCTEWRSWFIETLLRDEFSGTAADTDKSHAARHLLLPSMMRAYTTQPHRKQPNRKGPHQPSSDHFCVAWFASEGIRQLSFREMLKEDDVLEKLLLQNQDSAASRDLTADVLVDTNHHSESQDDKVGQSADNAAAEQQHRAAQQAQRLANQSFQWQRKGKGVVLSDEWRGYRTPIQVLLPFGYTPALVQTIFDTLRQHRPHQENETTDKDNNSPHDDDDEEEEYAQASFAVPGVTVARPESYCLCIDRYTKSGGGSNNQVRLQRLKDRRDLRRSVLPRVMSKEPGTPPFVQFLNFDKASAVTLMTPALACGTLREPFTVFLVGIATEDGCFLSGLRHRFEIGHLYPRDQLADITDSSAICLFTEDWSAGKEKMEEEDEEMAAAEDNEEILDSDEELRVASGCRCIFEGVTEKLSVLEDRDERHGRLVRGVLGPGQWHCYTVRVDGRDSMIRIDGVEEPMEIHDPNGSHALLDGLTLGSDHCFGTSLCCGQGSPGEGEGAMAEVAVFAGRMDTRDLVTMEKLLMKKHGIPAPMNVNPWREDDLYRQARAMFQLVGNPRGTRVPLRYFTKSPNVAWKVMHPVSNQPIKRERIGARNDESSSDW